jgi:hypothetical protein
MIVSENEEQGSRDEDYKDGQEHMENPHETDPLIPHITDPR